MAVRFRQHRDPLEQFQHCSAFSEGDVVAMKQTARELDGKVSYCIEMCEDTFKVQCGTCCQVMSRTDYRDHIC